MKYLLVLQLPETTFTYDQLVDFENHLIREVEGIAEIDGHDIGVGELNIFVLTDDIDSTIKRIEPLFENEIKKTLKAAYREVDGEQYHVLYPSGLKDFHVS